MPIWRLQTPKDAEPEYWAERQMAILAEQESKTRNQGEAQKVIIKAERDEILAAHVAADYIPEVEKTDYKSKLEAALAAENGHQKIIEINDDGTINKKAEFRTAAEVFEQAGRDNWRK